MIASIGFWASEQGSVTESGLGSRWPIAWDGAIGVGGLGEIVYLCTGRMAVAVNLVDWVTLVGQAIQRGLHFPAGAAPI